MKLVAGVLSIITFLGSLDCIAQQNTTDTFKIVYESDRLIITQKTEHVYVHTSFLNTETIGRSAAME